MHINISTYNYRVTISKGTLFVYAFCLKIYRKFQVNTFKVFKVQSTLQDKLEFTFISIKFLD